MSKLLDNMIEYAILIWVMVWLIPALPELIKQGQYEQDLQKGKIG